MTTRIISDGAETRAKFRFAASLAVAMYSLMYHDGDEVKPFSSLADQGTEPKNQREAARRFAGLAADQRTANETVEDAYFPVTTDAVVEMDCPAATFEVGDLVGPSENGDGNGLLNAQVEKVSFADLAIGVVTKRYASNTTRVQFRVLSRLSPHFIRLPVLGGSSSNVEVLAADKTLSLADARIQVLDPGGAGRKVLLPAEASSAGEAFIIHNGADAAEVLTIKEDSDTTTICTPTQNESAIVYCDGTTWRGIVGVSN